MAVLYGNDAFSILVLSTKKRYSSFLKKVFVFQKICFKVKVLKTFKIFTDCHIKACRLSNGGLFWKSLVPFFRTTYAFSVGFKVKSLRKGSFSVRQKPTQVLPYNLLKGAAIHLCDESHFSNICTLNTCNRTYRT